MKIFFVVLFLGSIFSLSSCAKCNICETDGVEKSICTNSILDRSKAKANCKKEDGLWLNVERQ